MNARSENGQLAKKILLEFMQDFQSRNPNLYVFSAHLHMDEETPHVHVDFVPVFRSSKRGLDTRVSLKGALAEQGFKGGTGSETEWNQWIASEKQELSKVMERYGVQWKQLGTHNKHLSVLDFEKQERQKEVAQLEQDISGGMEKLSFILSQQVKAEQEMEQVMQRNEEVRQKTDELSATNALLREQTTELTEGREKLRSDNQKLEKEQKRLQQEIEKIANSKAVMERNIYAYDENKEWQLPEPGALTSAKAYRDKSALSLVEKLKDRVKELTVKCVQLMEQVRKLTDKTKKQEYQISRLTDKIMEQSSVIENLQEKVVDFGRLERHFGKEKVQAVIEQAKKLEQAERALKQQKQTFNVSR